MTGLSESLTDRTARAAKWRLASAMVGAVSQFAIGVLLARLLTPADFGVLTLAFVVLGLAVPLGDFGIGAAVVQRPVLTDRQIRTAFTFSVLMGIVLSAIVAIGAPLGSVVMREPQVTPVLRALSAGFVLAGAAVVSRALLRRQLDFRRQFFIETTSYVLGYGGLAVTLAVLGHGVWSLVWGGLLQTLIASGALLATVRHPFRPLLATSELRELLRFGFGATASGCVNYVALNGDNFVVGRSLGVAGLGLYSRAYALMNIPLTYAASVLSGVLFPAFTQVQGEPERLRRGYLLATRLTATVAAPAMVTMAIVAPHLIYAIYGPQWMGVVVPLQILCGAGYFRALYHLGGMVAQSVGWVYSELWCQVVYAVLVIAGALIGSRFGLPGVAAGVSVAILYMFVASGQLALRATGTRWSQYVRVQRAALVTAAVTCAVALAVRLAFEAWQTSSAVTTLAVLAAAAVPWSVGALWMLGAPDFSALRTRLPGWCVRLIEALSRARRRDPNSPVQRTL